MDAGIIMQTVTLGAMIVSTVITGLLAKKRKDRVMWALAAAMAGCAAVFTFAVML